jgi:SPX domain protein involved in polyphosphate accumulation
LNPVSHSFPILYPDTPPTKSEFNHLLNTEMAKVDTFWATQKQWLSTLTLPPPVTSDPIQTRKQQSDLTREIDHLRSFLQLNTTASQKISKKFTKHTGMYATTTSHDGFESTQIQFLDAIQHRIGAIPYLPFCLCV